MYIRSTTDPITLRDILDPEYHPCLYEGNKKNGLEIYFENEENKRLYMDMQYGERKIVQGNDTDDYVANG